MSPFPEQQLTEGETSLVQEALSHPSVIKYFQLLSYNIGSDLATASVDGPAEDYIRRVCALKGALGVLTALLDIKDTLAA